MIRDIPQHINLPFNTISFSLFRKTKYISHRFVLTDLSIFREGGKSFVTSETRIAYCRLFIVRHKKVYYERKVREELLGCFFHCKLEWLRPYVPTASLKLMSLRTGRVEEALLSKGASVTMKQAPHLVISKTRIETLSIDKLDL